MLEWRVVRRQVAARLLAFLAVLIALPATTRADIAEIQSRGTLRVLCSAEEHPAWFAIGEAEPPGFERELLEGFARLLKVKLEVVPVQRWDSVLQDLIEGRGDVIAGINDTAARRKRIAFSVELVPARQIVVTRRPHHPVGTVSELKAERVGVTSGTTWVDAVAAAGVPATQVHSCPDLSSCLEALRRGTITATVMDIVDLLLQQRTDPDLQDGATLGEGFSSAWGVRQRDVELKRQLDDYLQNTKRTPTWSRLVVKYFGDDALRVLGRSEPR